MPHSQPKWHSLRCGENEIGHVRVDGAENFYVHGRFRAGQKFAEYEPLFTRAYQAWSDNAEDPLDILEEVNTLGLYLVDPLTGNASAIRDFQLAALDEIRDKEGVPVEFKFVWSNSP